jgi:L-fucose isomerase-like protein
MGTRDAVMERETASKAAADKPVGVLILGRKRPGFDQEWNKEITQRCLATMAELGLKCVGQDVKLIDYASLRVALKDIEAAGCNSLVMLQPSMGNGQLALSLSQAWPGPIVLWATPERPGDGKASSCSLVGQHLWAAMLREANHPFEFVYGDPGDAQVKEALLRGIALARTVTVLKNAKVGMIGTHAPGFVDLAVDAFVLRNSLGLQLHPLSLPQFIDRVKQVDAESVRADVEKVRKMALPLNGVEEKDLEVNSRCYLAMLDLMREESLTALCIQCWPELPEVIGQWPYLAIARLTSEGHAVAMEGDVDGAIAELMGNTLGLGHAFLTDWLEHDENTIFLWHPGMAPIDMIGDRRGPTLAKHFNIVKPLVVDGELRENQPVTIARLWHCDNQYLMTAFEGRSIPPRRTITGNSLLVEVAGRSVPERFDTLIHEGMPHHVLMYYGHCAERHRRLARLLGIRWVA